MNAITYALNRLVKSSTIPRQVLNMAFLSRYSTNDLTLDTLYSKIREEVIDDRVLTDINLVNTTQLTIPLNQCERLEGTYYTSTWRVPNSLTQGRSIVSVLHVTAASGMTVTGSSDSTGATTGSSGVYTPSMSQMATTGAIFQGLQQAVRSTSPVQVVNNALCFLVGYNTVLIKDCVIIPATMHLRVNVEMDENLNQIQPPYYTEFYKLVVLAVKMYIYNRLIIDQDTVFINSGGELNKFRDIVEGFSDAEEQYTESLEEWFRSSLLNDSESSRRHYQMRVGGDW